MDLEPANTSGSPTPAQDLNQAKHEDDGAVEPCVICLQPITERAITVPCNHWSFDFICLASWLNERSSCPLCNVEVSVVQYDWRSPHDFKSYNVPKNSSVAKSRDDQQGSVSRSRNNLLTDRSRRPPVARPRSVATPTEDDAVRRRRHVYRHQLYSLHVGSNRVSRYRNVTPQDIAADEQLQSRARKWIRRELRVFAYLQPNASSSRRTGNAEFLLEYIIAILKTVEVKDSGGQAETMLSEFLGRADARLFLHELDAWLRSPYINLHDWDRHVQYDESGIRGGRSGASRCDLPTSRCH